MTKPFISAAIAASMIFMSCKMKHTPNSAGNNTPAVETNANAVPYTLAKNYFVKNTFKQLDNPKIETEAAFNEIFGMGAFMGENGTPTHIDFATQYAIAVILPETEMYTNVSPVGLIKNAQNGLTLNYKVVIGQKQSSTMRPFFVIVVDKKENGSLTVKEIK